MSEPNNCTRGRASAAEDDVSVVFHKLVSHAKQSHCDQENDSDEQTEEHIHLRCFHDDAERKEEEEGAEKSRNSQERSEKETLCTPATPQDEGKRAVIWQTSLS